MDISRHLRTAAIFLAANSALLANGDHSLGGFIASDMGTNGSYNGYSGYNLTGPKVFTGQGYGLAVEFTVGGTSPIAFGSATLALAYRGGTDAVQVILASSSNGAPGVAMETFQLAGLSSLPSIVTVTSTTHSILEAGTTYWLEAIATNDTNMTWLANSQGQSDHLAYRLDTGSGPGPWSLTPGNADPAFSVSDFAAPAAVPSPSSLSLLGLGLIGLIGRGAARRLRPA